MSSIMRWTWMLRRSRFKLSLNLRKFQKNGTRMRAQMVSNQRSRSCMRQTGEIDVGIHEIDSLARTCLNKVLTNEIFVLTPV